MKWVKKGALIRCCDDHVAAKLLTEGYEEFFPAVVSKPEPQPAPEPEPKGKKD